MNILFVNTWQKVETWKCLSGQDLKGVRGIKELVVVQHVMDIWKFLNMQDPKGVRGMINGFAQIQQGVDTWKFLNM